MEKILGVDLSHWNGTVDFKNLAENGVKFVMLKLGGEENGEYSYKIDTKFFTYYHAAKAAGIKVGAYMFAGKYCWRWQAEGNATYFIDYMEKYGVKLDYPFAIDVETQDPCKRDRTTTYVYNWCKCVEDRGYFAMIYGSDISTFDDILDSKRLERFAFWVARYGAEEKIKHPYAMWQFTNNVRAHLWGDIPKNIDGNYAMYDIAEVIERKHLNHK